MRYNNKIVTLDGEEFTLVRPFYLSLDCDKAAKSIEGDATYIVDSECKDNMWSIFSNAKPNLEKGHQPYVGIHASSSAGYITGFTKEEFEKDIRFHDGKACEQCKEIIYSAYRHDYRVCSCDTVMIDGGRDYTRGSLLGIPVVIDFLTVTVRRAG